MTRMLDSFFMTLAVLLLIACGLFLPVDVAVDEPSEDEDLSTSEEPAIAA